MEKSHCGKVCGDCDHKRQGLCPGCEEGPSPRPSGDCPIARCCHGKGYEACGACDLWPGCDLLAQWDSTTKSRLWRWKAQVEQQERMTRRARFLGKWLRVLFWLFIPSMVAAFLSGELVAGWFPPLGYVGMVLSVAASLTCGGVLLMLGREEPGYRTAGICSLAALALNTLALCFLKTQMGVLLLLMLAEAILSLVAIYKEFSAHREASADYAPEQSRRWHALWDWYLCICVVATLTEFLAWGLPKLAALIWLLTDIATIVVGIVRLVYLYRMSRMLLRWEAQPRS